MKRVAGLDVHKDSVFVSVKKGRYQNEQGKRMKKINEL